MSCAGHQIDGGEGKDTLLGDAGADVFVFDAGYGADRIRNMNLQEDRLEISQGLIGDGVSVADMLASYGQATGANTYSIAFSGTDILTITSRNAFDANDLAGVIDLV